MAENSVRSWLLDSADRAPSATILLRIMAGGVFLWEGILKFIYPSLGIIRFTKLGIPLPHIATYFIAILEIVGGSFIIAGFLTRIFSTLFICEMIVAILSTKIPMLLNTFPLPVAPVPPTSGLGLALHDGRSDLAQIMTMIFLLIMGQGRLSIDALIGKRYRQQAGIRETERVMQKEKVYQQ